MRYTVTISVNGREVTLAEYKGMDFGRAKRAEAVIVKEQGGKAV